MPTMPYLPEQATYRDVTDTFAGYNHNLKITAQEFYDTRNMTTELYPVMSPRKKRSVANYLYAPGDILAKEHLAYINEGVLYYNDSPTPVTGLSENTRLVSMGAYILAFPQNKYYNTADSADYGSMDSSFNSSLLDGATPFAAVRPENTNEWGGLLKAPADTEDTKYIWLLSNAATGADPDDVSEEYEKFNPGDRLLLPPALMASAAPTSNYFALAKKPYATLVSKAYFDTSATYEELTGNPEWKNVNSSGTGTRLSGYTQNPLSCYHAVEYNYETGVLNYVSPLFKNDQVRADHIHYVEWGGSRKTTGWLFDPTTQKLILQQTITAGSVIKVVYFVKPTGYVERKYGMLFSLSTANESEKDNTNTALTTDNVPDMDFIIECKNRIWGCKYGVVKGKNLNEIYACELGNFRNWRTYEGLSTDPYTASVGSDGPWTGAINYQGYPTFFKRDRLHRVAVSASGAHEITETVIEGVQPGSGKSLRFMNGALYYKSDDNVCCYAGGLTPTIISKALGNVRYHDAVAGTRGDRYYISMLDEQNNPSLFVYDAEHGLWIKEDDMRVKCFAELGTELYCVNEKNELIAIEGSKGEPEELITWHAESGVMYYQYPDKKYVSRFDIRLNMEQGARMRVFIEYDSSGRWEPRGELISSGLRTLTLPIRPRRCDHLRLRFEGRGYSRIYSVARILEIGSDY